MNHYGARLMTHWKTERPQAYRELVDPEQFFTQLGEEVAEQIEERARSLAAASPPGEQYLERLQRLNTARLEAEGEVMREQLQLAVDETPPQ